MPDWTDKCSNLALHHNNYVPNSEPYKFFYDVSAISNNFANLLCHAWFDNLTSLVSIASSLPKY